MHKHPWAHERVTALTSPAWESLSFTRRCFLEFAGWWVVKELTHKVTNVWIINNIQTCCLIKLTKSWLSNIFKRFYCIFSWSLICVLNDTSSKCTIFPILIKIFLKAQNLELICCIYTQWFSLKVPLDVWQPTIKGKKGELVMFIVCKS